MINKMIVTQINNTILGTVNPQTGKRTPDAFTSTLVSPKDMGYQEIAENPDYMAVYNYIMHRYKENLASTVGVKEAILRFMRNNDRYRKVSIEKDLYKTELELYAKISDKKSVDNPDTMFCFQKLK